MKQQPDGELDFAALERASGVILTAELRVALAYTVFAAYILDPREGSPFGPIPNKELLRTFRAGITAAEGLLRFLDFLLPRVAHEYARISLIGDEEEKQAIVSRLAIPLQDLQKRVSWLLSHSRKISNEYRGGPGRRRGGFESTLISLVNPVFHQAGGTGPYYKDEVQGYAGRAGLDFYGELFRQLGCSRYKTQGGLAQAIRRVRRRMARKLPKQLRVAAKPHKGEPPAFGVIDQD